MRPTTALPWRARAVHGALLALALLGAAPQVLAASAEIVLLQGKGEKSDGPERRAWVAATQGDQVDGGYWVRTLANSQMALLVPENNQIRLNQNSELQLKTESESAQFQQARVKLARGRAWSQAKPRAGAAAAGQPSLAMETPSATMSIRGTDWEVVVADDGTTQLVVLSGEVDVSNEHGALAVGKGEAARIEPGKAPVKLVLIDPSSRVQWVSAWVPEPGRWIGADAANYAGEIARIESGDYEAARTALEARAAAEPGAAVLAGDLLVHEGDLARAVGLLSPHAAAGRGDARASALLARALVRLDRLDEAEALLDTATTNHPQDAELQIARGELAVLRGDPVRAEAAFRAALAAAQNEPSPPTPLPQAGEGSSARDAGESSPLPPAGEGGAQRRERAAEAWYGLGLIASEREYVRDARKDLDQSLALAPAHGKAAAERAAVETFANNLDEAAARYDALLAADGANYEALTGRGINKLKQGDPEAALQDFLKAGVIEPRYARAWLYQGVAFYQMGERLRAAQAFARAEELDARDPIPHMMASQTEADRLDFGAAIAEARVAQQKMPFLRSLNQLASDQKGSANVGSPIAQFGLEEWAKYYADEAYSPYWGGSHLFLADRYTGRFLKNSELMQGFLADPLAFGASNRDSSLVQRPGHYGRVDAWGLNQNFFVEQGVAYTANGMLVSPAPLAYFLRGELSANDYRKTASEGNRRQLTLGTGWRPRHDLGFFLFGTENREDADVQTRPDPLALGTAITDGELDDAEERLDIGSNFNLGPENQFWLKAGGGSQTNELDGDAVSAAAALAIEDRLPNVLFANVLARGELERNDTRIYESDLQFRHAFSVGQAEYGWGMERARQEQRLDLALALPARVLVGGQGPGGGTASRIDTVATSKYSEEFEIDDELLYLTARLPLMRQLTVQLDAHMQEFTADRVLDQKIALDNARYPVASAEGDTHSTNINPRLGLRWDAGDGQQIRLVGQRWRKPASFGSLAAVDTLGIALDDTLTGAGGKYERLRLQYDGEFGGRLFIEAFADREVIDNDLAGERSPFLGFQVEALSKLRVREEFFTASDQIEATPFFPDGSVSSFGLAANYLRCDNQALSARYVYRYGDNNSDDPAFDGEIPYIPHHYFEVGSQWSLPWRLQLRTDAVYRSRRFQNDADVLEPARSGWSFRMKGYWETADKHHNVQFVLDNLFIDQEAMIEENTDQYLNVSYSYRF